MTRDQAEKHLSKLAMHIPGMEPNSPTTGDKITPQDVAGCLANENPMVMVLANYQWGGADDTEIVRKLMPRVIGHMQTDAREHERRTGEVKRFPPGFAYRFITTALADVCNSTTCLTCNGQGIHVPTATECRSCKGTGYAKRNDFYRIRSIGLTKREWNSGFRVWLSELVRDLLDWQGRAVEAVRRGLG